MMSRRLLYALVLSMTGIMAAGAQDVIKSANAAYEKDQYDRAIELYNQAARELGTSSELYYNIGNANYRLGNMGEAILYYERALKLNPANSDARTNLEFVKEKINVDVAGGDSYFTGKIMRMITGQSSNTWATISVVLFLIFVASLLTYIFMDSIMLRKIGFFGGGIVLLMFIGTLSFAFVCRNHTVSTEYAIVTVPSSTLSTSPRVPKDKTEEAFLLNEGYKVQIVDSVKTGEGENALMWYDVTTADGHRAWIKQGDIEII